MVLLFGLLVLGGFGYWYFLNGRIADTNLRYSTETAQTTDLIVTVTATGTVEPTNKVEISSELSGTIRSVEVDYNDTVEIGQVLAHLDTDKLEATVELKRAALVAAKARVDEAKATLEERRDTFERTRTLSKRGIASQEQMSAARAAYLRAQTAVTSTEAEVRVAEANLQVDEANLAKACICSPIKGVVLDRNIDSGQIVASALQAPVLFTIAEDLRKMELLVNIDEADIGQVKVGDAAEFSVEAFQDRSFPASISQIRYAPETVEGVVTYKAVLVIDNAELLLRPGMTATADITVAKIDNALTISNAALRFAPPQAAGSNEQSGSGLLGMIFRRPPSSEPTTHNAPRGNAPRTLWILKDDSAIPVEVIIGATDGRITQIVSGDLAPGDRVITGQLEDQ